jgi:hypothetical protein
MLAGLAPDQYFHPVGPPSPAGLFSVDDAPCDRWLRLKADFFECYDQRFEYFPRYRIIHRVEGGAEASCSAEIVFFRVHSVPRILTARRYQGPRF